MADGYDIATHGAMLRDERRVDAYLAALRGVVTPSSVVLEIGTGVGFFAVAAAQMGARRVFAVESDDTVYLARAVIEANAVTDRVVLLQGSSFDLAFDEKVHVVVSDLHGVLPWFGSHLPTILDVRSRLLVPGGALIPRRDDVWACLVSDESLHRRWTSPWSTPLRDVDLGPIKDHAINTWGIVRLHAGQVVTPPARVARLDYATLDDIQVRVPVQLAPDRPCTVHGVGLWFDTELGEGIRLSNAPASEPLVYGQAFFPFEESVVVRPGVVIEVRLHGVARSNQHWWKWSTATVDPGGQRTELFAQSSVRGLIVPP